MSNATTDYLEVAVIGLARSGRAAAELLARRGARVYASDAAADESLASAAEWLRARGVGVDLGGHDLERISRAGLVVVSPGVSPDAAAVRAAREAGVRVVSEIAVALQALPETSVIAVTGTNGKSTTTALIAHLLTALGRHAASAGNIGRPLSELALEEHPPEWVALEVSSFQLHDTPELSPAVGVLTNLAPDHLDRYATVEDYYGDKARLFAAASDSSRWVTNADDREVQGIAVGIPGIHYRFSIQASADAHFDRSRGMLVLFGRDLCDRAELRLLGDHNVANALAAALAVAVADEGHRDPAVLAAAGKALSSFEGLPHRLELVAEVDGVEWINDSKATNVESALVAIEAMTRPTVLLLGGKHKGEPYTALADPIRRHVRHVLAYGEAAPIIERDLSAETVAVEPLADNFAGVVQRARELARSGDAVLLAPACSSYDMFRDYEERGAVFRKLARGG